MHGPSVARRSRTCHPRPGAGLLDWPRARAARGGSPRPGPARPARRPRHRPRRHRRVQRAEDLRPAARPRWTARWSTTSPGTASSSTSTPPACTWSCTCPAPAGSAGGTRSRRPRRSRATSPRSRPGSCSTTAPGSTSPRPAPRSGSRCTSSATRTTCPASPRLGPDPLADDFTIDVLGRILRDAGRAQIKGVLRHQGTIAGIGNAYSDELLHAAQMSPFKPASSVADDELQTLYDAIRRRPRRRRRALPGAGRGRPQGREEEPPRGARPHRPALPGLRRHRARGVLRRLVAAVLPHLPDRRQAAGRPADCPSCSSSARTGHDYGRSPPSPSTGVPDPLPEGLHVLDVREDVEWQHGHIDGAMHIPLRELPARLARDPRGADPGGLQGRRPLRPGRAVPAPAGPRRGQPRRRDARLGRRRPADGQRQRPAARSSSEAHAERRRQRHVERRPAARRGTPRGAPSTTPSDARCGVATARRAAAGRRARRGAGRPARPAPPSTRR